MDLLYSREYLYLFYGFAFLVLALVCFLSERSLVKLPLAWLGAFGVVHGTLEWQELISLTFGDSAFSQTLRTFLVGLSFLLLFEFARRALSQRLPGFPGPWFSLVPLIPLALGYVLLGSQSITPLTRYFFSAPGSFMAVAALLLTRREEQSLQNRIGLLIGAIGFALYGFSSGLTPAAGDFFPANMWNSEKFLIYLNIPVQLARGGTVLLITLGLYLSFRPASRRLSRRRRHHFLIALLLLILLLAGGWTGLGYLSGLYNQDLRSEAGRDLEALVSRVKHEIGNADGASMALAALSQESWPPQPHHLERLQSAVDTIRDSAGGGIAYLMDVNGTVRVTSNRDSPASFLDKNYRFRPYFQSAAAGQRGAYFALGVTSLEPGYYASHPLKNAEGVVTGAAVFKKTLDPGVLGFLSYGEVFLIDRHGVVLVTGLNSLVRRPLWPIPAEIRASLDASRQFGAILNQQPILGEVVLHGQWLEWQGKRYMTARAAFNAEGWSVLLLKQDKNRIVIRLFGAIVILLLAGSLFLYNILLHREATAEERMRKLSQAVEQSPASIVITNRDANIEYVNPRFTQITGYEAWEVEGKNPRLLQSGRTDPRTYAEMWATVSRGVPWKGVFVNRRKNGECYWEEAMVAPIVNEEGELTHLLGIKEEITARRELEQALLTAKEQAEAANRAKSAFLANMSHEIRTPMNTILGLGRILLETTLSPSQRDYLSRIHDSSRHLLSLLNNILDFSKIEAGRLELEQAPFELCQLFDHLDSLTTSQAAGKGLEILFDVPATIPRRLEGDLLRLEQVLINLLQNAIKFTQSGEVMVRVRQNHSRPLENGQVALTFEVRDTGCGIDPRQRENLFRPFSQGDLSTTRRFGGTGLGLAISQSLIGLMSGTLEVDSTPGQGSRFHFTVTLKQRPEETVPPPMELFLGRRVLVLDSAEGSRRIVRQFALELGMNPREVESFIGLNSLLTDDLAGAPGYDLCFLDARFACTSAAGSTLGEILLNHRWQSKPPAILLMVAFGLPTQELPEALRHLPRVARPVRGPRLRDAVVSLLSPERAVAAGWVKPCSGFQQDESTDPNRLQAISGARVLVVEDQPGNQLVARELLIRAGLSCEVADDGLQAIAQLQKDADYDLVFLDLHMPGLDGLETARRLRTFLPDLPLVAMTASALREDRERCLQAGMNDHLAKPIDVATLHNMLLRWIPPREMAARRALVKPTPPPMPSDWPESLEGIDLQQALSYTDGDRELVSTLLKGFASRYDQVPQRLTDALQRGDRREAAHQVHALKGIAGTLGATTLQRAAESLENALRKEAESDDQVNTFCEALGVILKTSRGFGG
ncbi:MAG: response regulator [Magnetococcales bacterium]|nr:response regulator [Magnetococcales bacterium]